MWSCTATAGLRPRSRRRVTDGLGPSSGRVPVDLLYCTCSHETLLVNPPQHPLSADLFSAICYKNNFCSLKEADSPKRLLLDSRVVGFADDIQPNCCHPFLLEALLFQWP